MTLISVKLTFFQKWKIIFELRTYFLFFVDMFTSRIRDRFHIFSNET